MQNITDRMIDDFFGEYERPRRYDEVVGRTFLDDILEDSEEEDDGSFCI